MTRIHAITGVLLLALAAFLGWQSMKLGYYTPIGPGPGFFPLWLCGLLALLSAGMVASALRSAEPVPADFWPDKAGAFRVGAIIASLLFALMTMNWLGFRPTMAGVALFLLLALGYRRLLVLVPVVLLVSFGFQYLFSDLLGLALPAGRLGL